MSQLRHAIAPRDRALTYLKELAVRFPNWKPAVDVAFGVLSEVPNDAYPALTMLGEPGIEASELEVHAGPQEITITFDAYHLHFDYEEFAERGQRESFLMLDGLQRELLAVATLWQGDKKVFTWILDPRSSSPVEDYAQLYFVDPQKRYTAWPWLPKERVTVRSWHGTNSWSKSLADARKSIVIPDIRPGRGR